MHLPVSPGSPAETNLLLRSLWAQIRREFGMLAWQFAPMRDAQSRRVYFGWADIGVGEPVRVGVTYKHRGIANQILFETAPGAETRLRECLKRAQAAVQSPGKFTFRLGVRTATEVHTAEANGNFVALICNGPGLLQLQLRDLSAFDEFDAESEFMRRAPAMIDALSFLTNMPFQLREEGPVATCDDPATHKAPTVQDQDWLEGQPIDNGRLTVGVDGVKLLDALAAAPVEGKLGQIVDAAHHFHDGLISELSMTVWTTHVEQAVVFYISALEAASLVSAPEAQSCTACGQPKYKIAARVEEFVRGKLGEHVASMIKALYGARSSYLHRGALFSSRSYVRTTIPQLDPLSENHVLAPMPVVPTNNLREFTSYCLRKLAVDCLT